MNRKIFSLAMLAVAFSAQAQNDSTKTNELNAVTVTVSRSEQKVITAPRNVTVIQSADIQKLPYQNLADLLQRFEGLYIPGTHQNPGALQSIFLRGADSKQTLVLIDGIKLSDNSSPDNALDFSEISLANIERIEIVRGAQGTLYGNSAVGGVINIITKKNAEKQWKAHANVQVGNYGEDHNSLQTQLGATFTDKSGFFAGGDILYYTINGLNSAANPNNGSFFYGEEDDFTKTDYALKAGYKKKGWNGFLSYRKAYQKSDIDDGAFMDDENYTISTNRDLFTWQIEKTFNSKLTAKFFGGYTFLKRYNFDDSSVTSFTPPTNDRAVLNAAYTGKNLTNELQLNYHINQLRLTGGIGYLADRMNVKSNYYNYAFGFGSESNYDTVGIKTNTAFGYGYADYSIPAGKNRLQLTGGARFSNHSRFGNFVTYELAPSFIIKDNASIFITYATGFNAPSLYQLFAPEKDFTSGITRGFGGLKAEESNSVEAGVKLNLKKNAALRLSVYANTVENVIEYVYLWNGSKPVNTLTFSDFRGDTYLNVGKQVNKGLEAAADLYPNKHWEVHFNMAYNHGELNYDASTIDKIKTQNNHVQLYSNGVFLQTSKEDKTIRRPSLMSNASLVYKTKSKWRFTLDARYVGKRKDVFYDWTLGPYGALAKTDIADYTLFNVSAQFRISKHISVAGSVFNLFDRHYSELSGFTTRPRMGLLTLQASL